MNLRKNFLFNILFGLVNAVTFYVDGEGEGGGSGEGEGDTGNGGEGAGGNTDGNGDGDGGSGDDFDSLPEFAKKMIKDLRSESAASRTKNKTLEERFGKMEAGMKSALGLDDDDQESPEERVQTLTQQSESLAIRNAILEVAIENGLNKDQSDYFGYLLQKEGESLEDDQEISEERYQELVNSSKALGAQGSGTADTDVEGDAGAGKGNGGDGQGTGSEMTAEQFSKLGYGEKVSLRQENSALYDKLFQEARKLRLL